MESITIPVDLEIAQAYNNASPGDRQKMQILFNNWLKQSLNRASLDMIIQDIQNQAQQNGLTQEILDELLSEDISP